MAIKTLVHTWSGDGVIVIDGTEYPVRYEIRREGNSNAQSTQGFLYDLPEKALHPHPQDDRLPLTLHTGQTVGVAVFGGYPCRMTINTPMPNQD
ncbi:hypothetical protein [Ensifer canadensis]|uniref:hypothetical protein n=1 Tax=Ensifer canadensis TaxID=555315 RepID=UPI0035E3F1FC